MGIANEARLLKEKKYCNRECEYEVNLILELAEEAIERVSKNTILTE
jgi:hypothetical protein